LLEVGADPVVLTGDVKRTGQPELYSYVPRLDGFTLRVDGVERAELPGGAAVGAGSHKVELTKGDEVMLSEDVKLFHSVGHDMAPRLPVASGLAVHLGMALELVNAPPPDIPVLFKVRGLALASVLPLRSSAAPLFTVMAPEAPPNAVVLPACRVPPVMVVPPV
jgi:hypothetical protein